LQIDQEFTKLYQAMVRVAPFLTHGVVIAKPKHDSIS